MTVKELIEKLQEFPQDFQVVLATDSMNCSPATSPEAVQYIPETTWRGEIMTEEDKDYGFEANNAVVIYPTN